MQSEGLNGEQEIREMAEDETEDENMQGEDGGAPGQGSGESGPRRESPGSKSKASRNYGKRKSEAEACGEVLDAGASPE